MRAVTPAVASQARSTRLRRAGATCGERVQVERAGRTDGVRGRVDGRGEQSGRQLVERVDVLAELCRGARQRLGHTPGQHVLQQRQHLLPQPDAGEPRVGVVRVVPHGQTRVRRTPRG